MELITRILACYNPPDPDAMDAMTSNERVRRIFRSMATAFPDAGLEVAWTAADDKRIVIAGRFHATHTGPWRGVAATGRPVSVLTMIGVVVDGERIADVNVVVDSLSIAEQIGAVVPLDPPACKVGPGRGGGPE